MRESSMSFVGDKGPIRKEMNVKTLSVCQKFSNQGSGALADSKNEKTAHYQKFFLLNSKI
jgi:hypothetical protein